jgi:hypothetical protein
MSTRPKDALASDSPNMVKAQAEAVRLARAHLAGVDLSRAAALGGLECGVDGSAIANLLGRQLAVEAGSLAVSADDTAPVHLVEEMLLLRYLGAEREVRPTGELITFRDMSGGNFYLQPILNRTVNIVLGVFGNDFESLRAALLSFPHVPLSLGDLSAAVHAIGRLDLTLVYRRGDEEFPATLDILFDRVLAAVYRIDEAAALANRLCTALARRKQGAIGR